MILLFSAPLVWLTSCGWSVSGRVAVRPLAFIIPLLFFKASHSSAFHLTSHASQDCRLFVAVFECISISAVLVMVLTLQKRETELCGGDVISGCFKLNSMSAQTAKAHSIFCHLSKRRCLDLLGWALRPVPKSDNYSSLKMWASV